MPYTASADAAPKPLAKPDLNPFCSVRRMHSTPIGPTGAAIEKPSTIPCANRANILPLFIFL
ncbi:MAG: hypothetical protein Q7J07_00430 [Pelolinea sp.]|nr:hypothetical protein [Pelolinea sp.]